MAGTKVWMNGEIVDWSQATVHVTAHTLHYGSGVFEGMRAYETGRGPAIFRLTEHLQRFANSARLIGMELPFTTEELVAASWDLIEANRFSDCYLRPIAYFGAGELRVSARTNPVEVAVIAWEQGRYFGDAALAEGIRAKVSSWQRVGTNVIPHVAKATGVYLNSMLAVSEALASGYDEAILLTHDGYVADGSGESIFLVRDGVVSTPDLSASILPGLTRASIIDLARDRGHPVVERQLLRTDLYLADEVFMVGTAAEVTPIREVDEHVIGPPGPITLELKSAYLDAAHGRSERWSAWAERQDGARAPAGSAD